MAVKFAGASPAQLQKYNELLQKLIDAQGKLNKREALHLYNLERIDAAALNSFSYSFAYYMGNTANLYNDDALYNQFLKDFPAFQTYVPGNFFAYLNQPVASQPTAGWILQSNLKQLFGLKLAVSFGPGLENGGTCPPFNVQGNQYDGYTSQYNDCVFRRAQYQRIVLLPAQPTYLQYNDTAMQQMNGSITSEQFRSWFKAVNDAILKIEKDAFAEVEKKFREYESFLLNQSTAYGAQQSLVSATNAATALQQTVNDILKDPVKTAGLLLSIFAIFALFIYLLKK